MIRTTTLPQREKCPPSACPPSSLPISDRRIVVDEPDIPDSPSARHTPTKVLVTRRSLVLGVPGQHALDAHAHAFHALHRRPAVRAEEIQTDDAVGVDVGMDRHRPCRLSGDGWGADRNVGLRCRVLAWRR